MCKIFAKNFSLHLLAALRSLPQICSEAPPACGFPLSPSYSFLCLRPGSDRRRHPALGKRPTGAKARPRWERSGKLPGQDRKISAKHSRNCREIFAKPARNEREKSRYLKNIPLISIKYTFHQSWRKKPGWSLRPRPV